MNQLRVAPTQSRPFPAARPGWAGLLLTLGSERGLLLFAYVLLGVTLSLSHGHFSAPALLLLLLATAALAGAAAKHVGMAGRHAAPRAGAAGALESLGAVGVIVGLLAGTVDVAVDGAGKYGQSATFGQVFIVTQVLFAGVVGAVFLRPGTSWRVQRAVLLSGVVLALAQQVGMIVTSPRPLIDVYAMFQQSSANLLHGINPYTTLVPDPWHGRQNYGYALAGYAYPPAGLYPQALGYLLAGDIRYAHLAAEAFAAACLYALVAPARRTFAALLVLLLLFNPVALFVLEQAWNEPLLLAAAGAFCLVRVRWPASRGVAVMLGLFLSLKQYLVYFAALYFAPRRRWRLLPLTAAVVLLTWLPFLIWDWRSAFENGLWFQLRTPYRADSLNIAAALHRWWGYTPPAWVALLGGGLTALATGWWFRAGTTAHWLYASILSTLVIFLTGNLAFCNYYYFVAGMVLFLLALRVQENTEAATPASSRGD
ncbi:hypothetical protein [Opitutus sp. ER46]|uniref:hypothetical protein n=1 Tax=Opitutus sp. ER46 TaxID=2161864 RepID=UPI000D2FBD6E|nr:hypothetical protein [Opitutus sp. ER46]PTX95731.1 hypothetical protein DB354_09990 [Opitutus sp. ER46]